MAVLRNKTILLISQQSWGNMFLAKHHYAIELAKRGNKVFFLNPPQEDKSKNQKAVEIIASGFSDNLWLIEHKLWFPYNIKFHAIPLFHLLMRPHIKKILAQISGPIDIVWSFDLGDLYPFYFFGTRPYKIFHPVDEPSNKTAIDSAKGCDITFSVTNEILEKYNNIPVPRHFINHGVSEEFFSEVNIARGDHFIHVGCSGNLLRPDIDRDILLAIIQQNPDVIFDFFGSYKQTQSNIGGTEDELTGKFISALKSNANVVLHGVLGTKQLFAALQRMDLFLICYDVNKDQSKGTNYHKIMEYLSTGKVILSNNVTTYKNHPDLITMAASRKNNEELPGLFKYIIGHLEECNAPGIQQKRIDYAKQNTYSMQLEKIDQIISPYVMNKK